MVHSQDGTACNYEEEKKEENEKEEEEEGQDEEATSAHVEHFQDIPLNDDGVIMPKGDGRRSLGFQKETAVA